MGIDAEVKNLESLLEYHDKKYYVEDDPEITDHEYDVLKQRYLRLTGKEEIEYIPGESIGEPVKHLYRVASLAKVNTEAEVRREIERLWPVVIEPKFDGLTVVGYPGTDSRAGIFATRGDGTTGENITHTAIKIEGINRVAKIDYAVRMEAYMPISVFNRLNAERIAAGEEPFKNPRNAAAGMLRNKDASKVHGVYYYAYNILGSTWSETVQLESLRRNGFEVTPHSTFESIDEAVDFVMNFDRHQFDFEIDGLVIKSNKADSLKLFGETGHHPKNAVAYKFPPEGAWTKLWDVTWQVGRTGKITPVAELNTVNVMGSDISRATLHNMAIINGLDLKIGAEVYVIKANDVIPAIINTRVPVTVRSLRTIEEPSVCPECKGTVEKINDQLFCVNPECSAKNIARLVHLGSRDVLDIEGLSDATAAAMFETSLIRKPLDIFSLTADQIQTLPGFAKKSAENLYHAIQAKKYIGFERFIVAAGIPGVGRSMSKDIANHFGSMDKWTDDAMDGFKKTMKISGVGKETINNLLKYGYMLGDLAMVINPIPVDIQEVNTPDKVLTIVITGEFGADNPRWKLEKMITGAGHKAGSSVSKKTDYVLIGNEAGSKADKAYELGFDKQGKILTTIDELKKVIGVK